MTFILCGSYIILRLLCHFLMLGIHVVFDSKLSFQGHIRLIYVSASSKLGIKKKASCLFGDPF